MNTVLKFDMENPDNIIQFPIIEEQPVVRTNSPLKSNGVPKATAADPIKNVADIHKMQNYFLEKGQLRNYMLITLGISFALRAGDLLSLTLSDVYEEDGTVKKYLTMYEDKTNKRTKIKIAGASKAALERYMDYLDEKDEILLNTDPLFPSRKTDCFGRMKSITIQQLDTILKKAAKECNIDAHISSHSMRKTYAYQSMQAHNNEQDILYTLQYSFNHSDIRTTFRYTGMEQEKVDNLRDEISNMLL